MDNTSIVYISAEVVVGIVSVIGNSIVLAAILRTRHLHTVTNVFVGNLAIADIAVGFLVAPLAALSFKGLPRDFYGCVAVNSLILLFTNVSIFMLLAVALERFLAIKEPFTYQRVMTVRRAIGINTAVWFTGIVFGLVPMYGWNSGNKRLDSCQFTAVVTYQYMVYFQFFGLVLLPLTLMFGIYIYILIIVRRHTRQTNALHRQIQHNNSIQGGRGNVDTRERRKFNKDVRAAKMFALLIILFGIFWLPVNVFNCLSLFCGDKCNFSYEALLVAIVMSHANSSINPLVYAASNSRIKKAIKILFGFPTSSDDSSDDINNEGNPNNDTTTRNREHVAEKSIDTPTRLDVNHHNSNLTPKSDIFTVLPERYRDSRGAVHSNGTGDVNSMTSNKTTPNGSHTLTEDNHLHSTESNSCAHDTFQVYENTCFTESIHGSPIPSNRESDLSSMTSTQISENLQQVKLFCVNPPTNQRNSTQPLKPLSQSRCNSAPHFHERPSQGNNIHESLHSNAKPQSGDTRTQSLKFRRDSVCSQSHTNFAFSSDNEGNDDLLDSDKENCYHHMKEVKARRQTPLIELGVLNTIPGIPVDYSKASVTPTKTTSALNSITNLQSPALIISYGEKHSGALNKWTEITKL